MMSPLLKLLDDDYEALKLRYSAMLMMLREMKGLSIEEVAGRLGVSKKAVWNWEHTRAIPSAYSAFLLSLFYGMPYEIMCCIPPKAHLKDNVQNPVTHVFLTLSDRKLEEYILESQSKRMGAINVWL